MKFRIQHDLLHNNYTIQYTRLGIFWRNAGHIESAGCIQFGYPNYTVALSDAKKLMKSLSPSARYTYIDLDPSIQG